MKPSFMEPLLIDNDFELDELACELLSKSARLESSIHPTVQKSLEKLVRSMNCYYSNFIEGHNTHPRDIDRALKKDFSSDSAKRDLQHEALAHIEVQELIENGINKSHPASLEFILWVHEEFFKRLPPNFQTIENPDTGSKISIVPGALRTGMVQVGTHIPPEPEYLEAFFKRFSDVYSNNLLTTPKKILASACSHHRLLWIHPFYDGNGRVARLFSHAYLKYIGIGNSLWSISRGLARSAKKYKELLMKADFPWQGDLDERGNLSQKALREFSIFFLKTCVDQIDFMMSLIEPDKILMRIEKYINQQIEEGNFLKGSFSLIKEIYHSGSIERGMAGPITGFKERQARKVLSKLIESNILQSDTPKGKVMLNFPSNVLDSWFPNLYPSL